MPSLLNHYSTGVIRYLPFVPPSDNDNDISSDVGSLASVNASAAPSTASSTTASPRMQMSHALNATPGSMGAPAIPPATKRALQRGRVEELGGEGSQSEGLDSPTWVRNHTPYLIRRMADSVPGMTEISSHHPLSEVHPNILTINITLIMFDDLLHLRPNHPYRHIRANDSPRPKLPRRT